MKKLTYLSFFFFSFLFYAQVPKVSEEEMYEVINFIIQNGNKISKNFKIITEDPNIKQDFKHESVYFDDKILKQYFNNADIKSIKEQLKTITQFSLNPKYILNLRIIHEDKLSSYSSDGKYFWTEFEKKHGKGGFLFVGKPIFTMDKKRVIINYGYYCGGLCGSGERVILRKDKNRWIIEKVISGFIS